MLYVTYEEVKKKVENFGKTGTMDMVPVQNALGATQYIPVDYDSNGDPVYQLMIMGETLSDGNTPIDCNVTGTCGMMLPGQTPQFYVFDTIYYFYKAGSNLSWCYI